MGKHNLAIFFCLFLCLIENKLSSQTTLDYEDRVHPEIAKNFMVVSQNKYATEAGYKILEQGGKVAIEKTNNITEIQGVNTVQQLKDLDAEFQKI